MSVCASDLPFSSDQRTKSIAVEARCCDFGTFGISTKVVPVDRIGVFARRIGQHETEIGAAVSDVLCDVLIAGYSGDIDNGLGIGRLCSRHRAREAEQQSELLQLAGYA
ncbi:hypothetical protein [Bradyrhizobium sp. USDA 4486]